MKFIELFIAFFKIGITTFGGGYAMIPILTREVAENKKWASEDELLEYYAIGQATPGIIAINTTTFVGYKVGGLLGAIVATLGFVAPSLIIIFCIFNFIELIGEKFYYAGLMVQTVAVGLILQTIYGMAKKQLSSIKAIILMAISFGLALAGISLPLIVIGAALVAAMEVKFFG